jgi:hypothetical protein
MTQRSATGSSSDSVLSTTRMDEPLGLQLADRRPDVLADDRRQPLCRLIEDQEAWIGHQRPADGQHLLLSAR